MTLLKLLIPLASCVFAIESSAHSKAIWLIEPDTFDAGVDGALYVPEYPVLVIDADKSFRLYRLHPACNPIDGSGRVIKPPNRSVECWQMLQQSSLEGVPSFMGLSVAGNAVPGASKGETLFNPSFIQATPDYLASRTERLVYLFKSFKIELGADVNASAFSTAWVLAGQSVRVEESQGLLQIHSQSGGKLTYRGHQGSDVAGAMNIVNALGTSGATYFRCTLAALEREQSSKSNLKLGLRELADLATQHVTEAARLDLARFESKQIKESEIKVASLAHRLAQHPAAKALQASTLGRYLGCPQADI